MQLTLGRDGIYAIHAPAPTNGGQETITSIQRNTMSGGCAPEPPREQTQTSTAPMRWMPANARGPIDPNAPNELAGSATTTVPLPAGTAFTLDKGTITTWSLRRI